MRKRNFDVQKEKAFRAKINHKKILDDRKRKLIEIVDTLKISKEQVGHIVHEYLSMRKPCEKCVPLSQFIENDGKLQ